MFKKLRNAKIFQSFKDFKKWSVTYQLLALLIILISVPVTVLLIVSFALYTSRAAGTRVYWAEGPNIELNYINETGAEPLLNIMLDTGTSDTTPGENNQVRTFQVMVSFDNSLINLAQPIIVSPDENITEVNPYFYHRIGDAVLPDSQAAVDQANSTGEFFISLIGGWDYDNATQQCFRPNGDTVDCEDHISGIAGIIKLHFVAISNETTQTQISFVETCYDNENTAIPCTSIDTAVEPIVSLPAQLDPLTVFLNPANPTAVITSTPTSTPRPTNTPRPTATPVPANTVIIEAIEDTYVDAAQPNTSFGDSINLGVDGSPEQISFFRFILPNVDPATITNASIVLGVSSNEGSSSLQSVHVPNSYNWDGNMTYNNRVGLYNPFTSFTADGTADQQADITNWVKYRLSTYANKEIVLAISSASNNGFMYSSLESGTSPQIVITLTDTPVSTSTPTPTVPNPTATPRPTSTPATSRPPDTTLLLRSDELRVALGTEFPVYIDINTGVNEVIGTELEISRTNRSVLTALDIYPQSFFVNPDDTNEIINNGAGTINYTILTPPDPNNEGVQGVGTLAAIDFRADAVGTTTISFAQDTLVAAVNVYQNALESTTPITIEVVEKLCGNEYLPGDIDNDCDVDIIDYGILFRDFGKLASDPDLVDPDSDINYDGVVNIIDYVYLFENFGRVI
ncbi:DNRLRE domain-containing protein [Candidatus Woesebacteria bacterium]|nr:DNRLRE domain-containing protein [Candidatus Woesebacteria bacterium]